MVYFFVTFDKAIVDKFLFVWRVRFFKDFDKVHTEGVDLSVLSERFDDEENRNDTVSNRKYLFTFAKKFENVSLHCCLSD